MAKELATPATRTYQNLIDEISVIQNTALVADATTPATPATLEPIGLVQTSACESLEDLSQLVTPLLVDKLKFKFKGAAVEELEVQLHLFMEKNGIYNDIVFSYMATSAW